MLRRVLFVATITLHLSAAAHAQQVDLSSLLSKTDFSREDVVSISTFLEPQARKLGAAKTERQRQEVKTAVLKWFDDPKATPQFKNVYAAEFVKAFRALIGGDDLDTAAAASTMLTAMKVPGAADGLIAALASPRSAVRYWGAKGLVDLRPTLKKPAEFGPALEALGRAGAAETEPLVLRLIYTAIDFDAPGGAFAGQDEAAKALNTIFEARLTAAQGSARREAIDQPGFVLAAKLYPGLKDEADTQKELVRNLARFLASYAARYAQLGPKGGGVALKDPVNAAEDALAAIARSAGAGSPPPEPQRMAARIAAGADARAVQQALAAWIGAPGKPGLLNADPWKLPIGLSE